MSITLITSVKNEGPWILEWVVHHKLLGFDEILIYSNDCDDYTHELLDHLQSLGYITHVQAAYDKAKPYQRQFLDQVEQHPICQQASWILYIDADELLSLKAHNNVKDFLSHYQQTDLLLLFWKCFGSSEHIDWGMGLMMERFTKAACSQTFKGFFKTGHKIRRLGIHRPIYHSQEEYLVQNTNNQPVILDDITGHFKVEPGNVSYKFAQINHYITKSKAEYCSKQNRAYGHNYSTDKLSEDFFQDYVTSSKTIDNSIQRFLPQVKEEYLTLLSDPTVFDYWKKNLLYHNELAKQATSKLKKQSSSISVN